jgi:hypothetical protein
MPGRGILGPDRALQVARPRLPKQPSVSKSLFAISGIGVAGCCVLALMMNHLVVRHDTTDGPGLARRLTIAFQPRLAGALSVREEHEGLNRRLVVYGQARGGDVRELAAEVGAHAWQRLARAADRPSVVAVTLRRPGGDGAVTVELPPPASTTRPPAAPSPR